MQARMRQMYLFAAVAVALVVVLGGTALAQSTNSEVGIWKLNVAKSKFSLGTALNSGTTQIEAAGAGVKVTVDTVGADGTVRYWEYTANYDGKDNPHHGQQSVRGCCGSGSHARRRKYDANRLQKGWESHGHADRSHVQ